MTLGRKLVLGALSSTLVLGCTSDRAANLRHPVGGTTRLTSAAVPPEERYAAPPRPSPASAAPAAGAATEAPCPAVLPTVEFEPGSSSLDLTQELALQRVAKCLDADFKGSTIVLVGRIDPNATVSGTRTLGLERASRVKDRLVQYGVPAGRIVVAAPGESTPVCNRSERACGVEILMGRQGALQP